MTTSLTIINDHGGQKLLVKVAPNSEVHQWVCHNRNQSPFKVAFYFKLNSSKLIQVNLFQKLATSAEHVVYQNCSECQNKNNNLCTKIVLNVKTKTIICVHKIFCRYSELTIFMNNLSSYCGLVDAKKRGSDKDLPSLAVLGGVALIDIYLCCDWLIIIGPNFCPNSSPADCRSKMKPC